MLTRERNGRKRERKRERKSERHSTRSPAGGSIQEKRGKDRERERERERERARERERERGLRDQLHFVLDLFPVGPGLPPRTAGSIHPPGINGHGDAVMLNSLCPRW